MRGGGMTPKRTPGEPWPSGRRTQTPAPTERLPHGVWAVFPGRVVMQGLTPAQLPEASLTGKVTPEMGREYQPGALQAEAGSAEPGCVSHWGRKLGCPSGRLSRGMEQRCAPVAEGGLG